MADKKDWERLFTEADKNGNGLLTAGELAKEMKRIGYPGTEAKIKAFLCAADHSGDRQLSLQEFVEAMDVAPMEFHICALLQAVFCSIDSSGDGNITADELQQAIRSLGREVSDDRLQEIMEAVDTDQSGTVNLQEFMEGIRHKNIFS